MKCRHCQQQLSVHLDNALSVDEHKEVVNHLNQCPTCTEYLRQLEYNRQLLRALPSAEITGVMEFHLQKRLQNSKPQASSLKSPRWLHHWSLVSFGTFVTCAASTLLYFAMMQAPPKVSAEEVVASLDQLLGTLDPDEGAKTIREETPDEMVPNWQEDLEQGFFGNEHEQK